jgi:hypothetical protein
MNDGSGRVRQLVIRREIYFRRRRNMTRNITPIFSVL